MSRVIEYTVHIDVLYDDIDIEKLRAVIFEDIDRACVDNAIEPFTGRSVLAWRIESTGD
jgi:hypothetical protein